MKLRFSVLLAALLPLCALAQIHVQNVEGWAMQDASKVAAQGAEISRPKYQTAGWYRATVPGTVLTTLVDNHVYPEPLYGENMRTIPESLNKATYWYRTTITVPPSYKGRRVWLHFGGLNYAAQIWLDGKQIGALKGAFLRGDFDITDAVKPGKVSGLAVQVSPQPHPGTPHEHTVANGTGHNGGETAIDGPTFLSTIGWDWLMAVRDRATGIWQPVTISDSGPVTVETPQVVSHLSSALDSADVDVSAKLVNHTGSSVTGVLVGTIEGEPYSIVFRKQVQVDANGHQDISLNSATSPALHMDHPKLWWPNGYGEPNLHHLLLRFETGKSISDEADVQFGIRKVEYQVPGSDVLTLVVNNVKVMVRGGNWGLDEAMKRIPSDRLEAQVRMHALANLNLIRNWVGQSTSPDLYKYADKYGIMLWDEFFQPNPGDGPNVTDYDTYLANVTDKVLRYRNHPSIVVWCARNEGHPPAALDAQLAAMMKRLDPERLYQSSSTDGRGVSSHGPYYWRAPHFFYQINEAFKTETGSVSVPTLESIQGMMPQKDWETINDDWAQHDMAAGAQRGNEYPATLAHRYGAIRNLADFARKAQMANYEAFRAMYESRNATMFQNTTGVITWMSHPAQPSFVWQLYHYDLEPNASLFAVRKAAEPVHVQMNEALRTVQVVNNEPVNLAGLRLTQTVYRLDGSVSHRSTRPLDIVPASSTVTVNTLWVDPHISEVYFLKLDLENADRKLLSTNFYWKNVAQDDFTLLDQVPPANLTVIATARQVNQNTVLDVTITNPGASVALLAHLQLHRKSDNARVLPVFYSDNYLCLAPGESRQLTIEANTRNLAGGPLLLLDGYNVGLKASQGPVDGRLNANAQPSSWPASQIVPVNQKRR
ncbi:glycoside hydrolase family 2 protein [Terriglobus aquaticus]|uniref:Glycosyl hydrolase 2 galactose-binding domain-containing protein n=1 Tax=Terriglobus aquaticus TaxID=940139 RepID=A0ABW9KK72_9BACT|nr:sugar-binding domain-containing protein [Terriglobus aquaticus]